MILKALGSLPWIALLGGMPFMNHAEPFVLGLPLPLAWATGCTLLSAATLFAVYKLDKRNQA